MYQYHYEYMMPKYGPDRAQLLFTDTDSLCSYMGTAVPRRSIGTA